MLNGNCNTILQKKQGDFIIRDNLNKLSTRLAEQYSTETLLLINKYLSGLFCDF